MKHKIKTIALTGTELKVKLNGHNCDIRNDGTDTVYASGEPNITAGADGVMSIPSGQAAKLLGCNGTLYLLGTGSVQLCGNDYAEQVFKCAPASGGSGTVDQTARDTINLHANNTDIHMTAQDVAALVRNDNLLINPDLKINQRGQTEYTGAGYTVDGWCVFKPSAADTGEVTVTVTDSGVTINNATNSYILFYQRIENFNELVDKTVTLSVCIDGEISSVSGVVTADGSSHPISHSINADLTMRYYNAESVGGLEIALNAGTQIALEWAKVEFGSVATQFTPPDPATELAKCQRYYQVRTMGDTDPIDQRPTMRITPTITQLDNGNYAYSAEL